MADISQTAANVLDGTNAGKQTGVFGATIVAGDVLYLDTTTGKWKKAIITSGLTAGSAGLGVALTGGGDGQTGVIQTSGNINPGGTAVVGTVYIVSTNAGKLAANADVTVTGNFKQIIGIATTASNILMIPGCTPVAMP